MKRSALLTTVLFLALLFFVPADVFSQCAMCKQSAESSLKSNPGSIARGLNSGILYLMAVPYLAILFIFRKQVMVLLKKIGARFSRA
jgi:hypothetical protein